LQKEQKGKTGNTEDEEKQSECEKPQPRATFDIRDLNLNINHHCKHKKPTFTQTQTQNQKQNNNKNKNKNENENEPEFRSRKSLLDLEPFDTQPRRQRQRHKRKVKLKARKESKMFGAHANAKWYAENRRLKLKHDRIYHEINRRINKNNCKNTIHNRRQRQRPRQRISLESELVADYQQLLTTEMDSKHTKQQMIVDIQHEHQKRNLRLTKNKQQFHQQMTGFVDSYRHKCEQFDIQLFDTQQKLNRLYYYKSKVDGQIKTGTI
jgi:hypothetical protein